MAAEADFREDNPLEHTCAWSGETFRGKAYIFHTTEGQELVSPEALFAGAVPEWHAANIDAVEQARIDAEEAAAAEAARKEKAEKSTAALKERRQANRSRAPRTSKGGQEGDGQEGDGQ